MSTRSNQPTQDSNPGPSDHESQTLCVSPPSEDIIQNEKRHCVIMGDMNIDLLKFDSHRKTSDYLDNLFSHGFLPVISKPTRVSNSSATLIDHIYTNDITSSYHSGIIINDVADHFGTFCIFQRKTKPKKSIKFMKRSFSKQNMNNLYSKLQETDFSAVLNIDCPHLAYNKFMELYLV